MRAIVSGGVIAGVLDAAFAVVAYVLVLRVYSLLGVLQYIASGLIGNAAFNGGIATAALGVGIHFAIALFFAALYVAAAKRVPVLTAQAIPAGIVYGALVWMFMDLVVLPHTGTPQFPFDPVVFTAFLADHSLFVGLPIALAARRAVA